MSSYEVVPEFMGYAETPKACIVDPCRIEYPKDVTTSDEHAGHTILRTRHRADHDLSSSCEFFQIYGKTEKILIPKKLLGLPRQDIPEVLVRACHGYSPLSF